jgi:hypothetical protein
MRLLLIFIVAALLIAGCAAPQDKAPLSKPVDNKTTPQVNKTNMTCKDYCPTLPHIQCVGKWNISGTYPDCVCSYECDVKEKNETTQTTNQTINETQNQTTTKPPLPAAKSLSELLSEGISKLQKDYYNLNSGSFRETTYTWTRPTSGVSPGEIMFDAPSEVTFGGKVMDEIQASAFVVFENTGTGKKDMYGLAMFKDAALDNLTGTMVIEYSNPAINKELRECLVYDKGRHPYDGWLYVYYFKCKSISNL